jgi:hypothetical protein
MEASYSAPERRWGAPRSERLHFVDEFQFRS